MLILHDKCKHSVGISCSSLYAIFADSFGSTKSGLKISSIRISPNTSATKEVEFWCLTCNKRVTIKELIIQCTHCGQYLPATKLFRTTKPAGILCESCLGEKKDGAIEMEKILSNISVES